MRNRSLIQVNHFRLTVGLDPIAHKSAEETTLLFFLLIFYALWERFPLSKYV